MARSLLFAFLPFLATLLTYGEVIQEPNLIGDIDNIISSASSTSQPSNTRTIFTKYKIFSKFGRGRSFLNNPLGITYCNHLIFVADGENHRIQAYNENGTFAYKVGDGTPGYDIGEKFQYPHGLSCYKNRLYVADKENSRIQIFHSENGTFINMFARKKDYYYTELGFPHDVAVCDDIIAILDTYNHRIQLFPLNVSHIRRIGSKGSKKEYFVYPEAITCHNHQIFVADTHNNRIQIYSTSGEFVKIFDLISNFPNSVAACNGRLFVGDPANHRITEYHLSTGDFITSIGTEGKGRYQFQGIGGLYCDDLVLFATDFFNHRVHIFPAEEILEREKQEGIYLDPYTGEKIKSLYEFVEGEDEEDEEGEEDEDEEGDREVGNKKGSTNRESLLEEL